jgi:hypothetical protein
MEGHPSPKISMTQKWSTRPDLGAKCPAVDIGMEGHPSPTISTTQKWYNEAGLGCEMSGSDIGIGMAWKVGVGHLRQDCDFEKVVVTPSF